MKREEPVGSSAAGPGGPLFFKAMEVLAADRHVLAAARLARERGLRAWLVGGALRNLFLAGPLPSDYDFVVEAGKEPCADLARAVACALGGAAFVLDKENGLVRVAVRGCHGLDADAGRGIGASSLGARERSGAPIPAAALTLDFLPLYCPTIEDDLARRDFTVNAMAVDLGDLLDFALLTREAPGAGGQGGKAGEAGKSGKSCKGGAAGKGAGGPAGAAPLPEFIDPSGGVRDCGIGVIRMVSRRALAEDPLRCLRAVRLSTEYGLEIEPATREEIRRHAHLLTERGVATERIRDELAIIFTRPGTAAALSNLASLGLMKEVMPAAASLLSTSRRPSGMDAETGAVLPPLPTLSALDDVDGLIEEMAGQGPSPWDDEIKAGLSSGGPPAPLLSVKMAAFIIDLALALVYAEGRKEEGGQEEGKKEDGEVARGLAEVVLTGLAFGKKTVRAVRGLISLLDIYEGAPARAVASPLFKPLFLGLIIRETGLAPPIFFVLATAHERAASRGPSEGGQEALGRTAPAMLSEYFEKHGKEPPLRIFSGEEIMRALGTDGGTEVGEVIRALERAVLRGEVRTMDEARAYIKKMHSQRIRLTKA